nr:serine/threonine-protein kinase [uncultured Steroidobacter sp.]
MKVKPPLFSLPSRYEFQHEILKGGQGSVYVCRDRNLDRLVAIKALHDVSDPTALTKEINGRALIKSKHVAELYDCILDPVNAAPLALVLEYVPGVSLADQAQHPAGVEHAVRILYQICSGVADIHAAGVIHRDIKPLNMKFDAAGVLKIFDLGIANLDASSAHTVGGAGTYVFRAPELYGTPPIKVTPAVDVYAVGVIVRYVLGKNYPATLLEIPPYHSGGCVESIAIEVPELAAVAPILDAALNPDPAERPTAAELRDALASFLTHAQRRAIFSSETGVFELKKLGYATRIEIKPYGTLRVAYSQDGRFIIREVEGAIFVNNVPAVVGQELPNSCVLTFGAAGAAWQRKFVPFDVSQPEIVL